MQNIAIPLNIPEDVLYSTNKNVDEFSEDVKTLIAVNMYKTGKLSLGKCAKLVNLCKTDFIKLLAQYDVSLFNWDEEEINKELNNVDKLIKELDNASRY